MVANTSNSRAWEAKARESLKGQMEQSDWGELTQWIGGGWGSDTDKQNRPRLLTNSLDMTQLKDPCPWSRSHTTREELMPQVSLIMHPPVWNPDVTHPQKLNYKLLTPKCFFTYILFFSALSILIKFLVLFETETPAYQTSCLFQSSTCTSTIVLHHSSAPP